MVKTVTRLMIIIATVALTSCGSSQPCKLCGDRPTKGYENLATGELEHYCERHSSKCEFDNKKATKYYTNALGDIIFVCEDCYNDIME